MILKLLLFCTILITSLNATNIRWYSSYDKALEEGHKQNKNLMIFISSNKSKKTNIILKEYFLNQDYIKYINKNFISVLITIEYKTSYPIELYYTTQFPSLFFASYKDESFLTHPIYDFKTKEDFLKVLYSIPYK